MKKKLLTLFAFLLCTCLAFFATSCQKVTIMHSVTFMADGVQIEEVTYLEGDTTVTEPAIPAKEGYSAKWEEYELNGDIVVNAVYTMDVYTVSFDVEGVEPITFTVNTIDNVKFPDVPAKEGYTASWSISEEDLTLADVTVNAVYTAIPYTVTFDVEGVEPITFTAETIQDVVFPAAPAKDGYTASWSISEEDLTLADVTVSVVYTALPYTVTFDVEGVEPITFTAETIQDVVFPTVPAKDGYTASWSISEEDLSLADVTVNAVYTAIVYTVTFDVEGVAPITFTVETIQGVVFPTAPAKDGYRVSWNISEEDLTLADVTVTVVEERLYTISFVGIDGYPDVVLTEAELAYAVIPGAPAKDGYVTGWENPVIDVENATVTITYWEIAETTYYTSDIAGEKMLSAFQPVDTTTDYVEWVEEENAYHFVNADGNTGDDRRALTFNPEYFAKAIEHGMRNIAFDIKLDAAIAGESVFRGFWPDWFNQINVVDTYIISGAQDWVRLYFNVDTIPTTADGALKTIFLLADQGSGMWIRNIDVWAPDMTTIKAEDLIGSFSAHPLSHNSVSYDATEGALLFTNSVTDQDDKRAFLMDAQYTEALKSVASAVSFQVKLLDGNASFYAIAGTRNPDHKWLNWGDFTSSGYKEGWFGMRLPLSEATEVIALLSTSGSFYAKNFAIIPHEVIPEVDANLTLADIARMFNGLAPASIATYDETEGAIRFTMDPSAIDDQRPFTLNPKFMAKLRAVASGVTFKVKFLSNTNPYGDDQSLYVSYGNASSAAGWWGNHQQVIWQEGWFDVTTNFNANEDLTLLLLNCTRDFLIKDFNIIAKEIIPDIDENLTYADVAKMFVGLAPNSTVTYDETEGALRFTMDQNAYNNCDDSRAFVVKPEFMAKLRAVTDTLKFQVKFLGTQNSQGNDRTFYVSYGTETAQGWYGKHQGVGWAEGWVDVTTIFNSDPNTTLLFVNSTGSFLLRNIAIPGGSALTTVHEYAIQQGTAVLAGLGIGNSDVVNNAPAGVNGTAIKLHYCALYAGFAIQFPAYTGTILPEYSVSFRIYAESSAAMMDLWFYKADYTDHAGNGWNYRAPSVATNRWVDVTLSLNDLAGLVDSQGEFKGFQFGIFSDSVTNFYIDSLSIVTVVNLPDTPLA